MTIKEYARALGVADDYVYGQAKVPPGIKQIIDAGEPIAQSYAQKICDWLSREYNRIITIEDITGLKTISPGKETEKDKAERLNKH